MVTIVIKILSTKINYDLFPRFLKEPLEQGDLRVYVRLHLLEQIDGKSPFR